MLYHLYEANRVALTPARWAAESVLQTMRNPFNPLSYTTVGRTIASACDVFEHTTRRYGKPEWELPTTLINDQAVKVHPEAVLQKKFCNLVHFKRDIWRNDPKLLIVAPHSGHYPTLLRGTVEAMLPDHEVYITDWTDARSIPVTAGSFDLDDYIDYLIEFLHFLGPNTHVIAVCQPAVPVMAATAIMGAVGDLCQPVTMTLIGGPIDTRESPTEVNKLAKTRPLEWYEQNVIVQVPPPNPGMFRNVYPGFIQLANFIGMNLDRHIEAHKQLFDHLVRGDEDEANKKREFYEEYRAVMDLPAEFYLQTVKVVFQEHLLPRGEWKSRWRPVDPSRIKNTAVLCVEGELDDISGVGQTKAALDLMTNLPESMKFYHLQEGAGHYGVFNGSKWRKFIAPRIKAMIREFDRSEIEPMVDAAE